MTLLSLFASPPLRLAGIGWLACAVGFSGCHVHVNRPCCKFNWRVSVCGLTSNCHECRQDCGAGECQPTLAPAPAQASAPVVQQISDLPYSVAVAANPTSGVLESDVTPTWQEVTPTVPLPAFPTQQVGAGDSAGDLGTANIAATLNDGSNLNSGGEIPALEMNFGPADSSSTRPAPQLLVPQEEAAATVVALPSKPTRPVRAQARDTGASNTLLVQLEGAAELPELTKPQEFASENGSGFLAQTTAEASARSAAILRLTAIPKLSPSNFPPLVTIQPAPLDPTAEPPVPYQIVMAPMATEPNRRPIEPRLEAQRLGSVIDATNTLRR